ncbi:MAG: glutamine synthetase family protein [Bacteroidales bacterium]|nr:glutamine synthetase family protein [Bacteroidales bacterium]
MNDNISMNPNPVIQYLNKPAEELTKSDLIRFIEDNDIEMINFRYAGWDGRLKTLNFIITSREHLDNILTAGERVDGSSLFPFVEAGSSDLYVVPRYKTAFVNPFTEIPTLDILCSFYDRDGNALAGAPENILKKAHDVFKEKTGYEFETMGELEYYIISEDDGLFKADDQKGYHESSPFSKWNSFRTEAMKLIAEAGGIIKYGHSEVGNFNKDGYVYEQNEIEFLPTNVEDAADQLLKAKWIVRTLAAQYGVTVTFAPKITVGKAGSGLHIHTRVMKNGVNQMIENGKLSKVAKSAIAGYMKLAPSLTAFGNLNPTSYFRLVPHQEAPTNICWGDRNRSVLVRVPLGWSAPSNMIHKVNPQESGDVVDFSDKQTVEFRSPDGSADIYLLLAGLTVAARIGLEMKDALKLAEKTYVDVNIFDKENKKRLGQLAHLPASCVESADELKTQMHFYSQHNIFPEPVLKCLIDTLKAHKDEGLISRIQNDDEKVMELVNRFFYCG